MTTAVTKTTTTTTTAMMIHMLPMDDAGTHAGQHTAFSHSSTHMQVWVGAGEPNAGMPNESPGMLNRFNPNPTNPCGP